MKKLLFFTFLSFLVLISPAQEIQKVIPAQPNEMDSIFFEIKTSFGNGSPAACPPFVGDTDSLLNNNLLIFDLYFDISGPWPAFGCVRYDKVDYSSLLPSGNYTMLAHWHAIQDTSGNNSRQMDTSARYASDTLLFTVTSTTGLEEFSTEHVKLFPNPVKEKLEVSWNSTSSRIKSLKITDISGREYELPIQKQKAGVWEIQVGSLPKGVYVVQLLTENGLYVEKFVKL